MSRSEKGRDAGREPSRGARPGSGAEPDDVVEVLRGVWTASGQTSADLDELFGTAKSCRNMRNVGFDALADTDAGGGLRGAWRATLEREGKLSKKPGSVRDLVLGPAEPGDR